MHFHVLIFNSIHCPPISFSLVIYITFYFFPIPAALHCVISYPSFPLDPTFSIFLVPYYLSYTHLTSFLFLYCVLLLPFPACRYRSYRMEQSSHGYSAPCFSAPAVIPEIVTLTGLEHLSFLSKCPNVPR